MPDQRHRDDPAEDRESRFRDLAEVAPIILWIVSPNWKKVLYVNPAFERIYGISRDQAYENPAVWIEAIHPDDRDRVVAYYREHHGSATDQEYRIVRPDGIERWIRDVATPITDDLGNLVRLAGFAEDVTARREASTALRTSEESFRAVAENAKDAIFIGGAGGRHLYVNDRASELTGYTKAELLEMTNVELTSPEERQKVGSRFQSRLAGDSPPSQYETSILHKDGRSIPIEATAARTDWHGQAAGVAVVRDITERRRFQRQLQQSVIDKETLLKETHHRVKNNLQIISGLLDVVEDSLVDVPNRHLIDDLQKRVQSMAVIHERLFLSDDLERIDAPAFLSSIVEHLNAAYARPRSAVTLTVSVDDLRLPVESAIPLGLIVSELISNAFKHAFPRSWERDTGERALTVSLRRRDDGLVELGVADNGVGLPRRMTWQESPSLGLQLVDSLIRQLDASVEVTRREGTAFRISFSTRTTD